MKTAEAFFIRRLRARARTRARARKKLVAQRPGDLDEHGHDAQEHLARFVVGRVAEQPESAREVDGGGALVRRAPGEPVQACLVGPRVLARTFGDVERNARRRPPELVGDGTLVEAWASLRSFRPKDDAGGYDGNAWGGFRGQRRSNETHVSTTDPEARLMRKGNGQPAKLSFSAHTLVENRNGLLVDVRVALATGYAEREVAMQMIDAAGIRNATLGADKAYDTRDFVQQCRCRNITPHVAQNNTRRRSAIDGRTTRWPGYALSLVKRRITEQGIGWFKTVATLRKSRYRGVQRTGLYASIAAAAYNLLRLARLVPAPS